MNKRLPKPAKYRACFVTSHPIQYQIPVFRHLAQNEDLDFTVYFCQLPSAIVQGDGFGVAFEWDVPLLDGYRYEVLRNVSRHPNVTSFSGCDTPEIGGRITHGGYDAVIVNGWGMKSSLQTLWACKRAGVPCLVRGEANDIRRRAWWKKAIQKQLVHNYAACLSIGEASRLFYLHRGVRADRIFSAPYCVDNDRLIRAASRTDRALSRRRFGLRFDSTVFLFCGKLEEKKHPLHLLEAIRVIANENINIEVLIVGDGAQREECESFASQNSLPVRFAGFVNQSQIVDAYVASDCLVLPSDHGETWGLVVNEAMVCGRPAIVSDQVGCALDLVNRGESGDVFPFGDFAQLAKIMLDCAGNPQRLQQWGESARIRVQRYSPSIAADGIWNAIEFACRKER